MNETPSPKDKLQNMDTRQKAIAGLSLIIFIVIVWQVFGMFGKSSEEEIKTTASSKTVQTPGSAPQSQGGVVKAAYPAQPVSPTIQAQIAQLQNETQQRYIVALNQLQLLKLSQQIVDINKDIAASKLNTVKSEKEIVDMLSKPAAPVEVAGSYSQNLAGPYATPQPAAGAPPTQATGQSETSAPVTVPAEQAEDSTIASYVVISVSNLLSKWGAVLGYQGRLYSVYVGDVMPIDGATVKSISKYGVVLEKGGVEKKISLVPII